MKPYLLNDEILLIEVDGWGIIEDTTHGGTVYAAHQKCSVEFNAADLSSTRQPLIHDKDAPLVYGVYCWEKEDTAKCRRCSEPVPDSIQTLVRIHSWKR